MSDQATYHSRETRYGRLWAALAGIPPILARAGRGITAWAPPVTPMEQPRLRHRRVPPATTSTTRTRALEFGLSSTIQPPTFITYSIRRPEYGPTFRVPAELAITVRAVRGSEPQSGHSPQSRILSERVSPVPSTCTMQRRARTDSSC